MQGPSLQGDGDAQGNGGASDAGDDGSSEPSAPGEVITFGAAYTGGQFHLGPVDWQESEWHNACAPLGGYKPSIRASEGQLLAGLWNGIADVANDCDACIEVTTAKGKSAVLRVVTYGDTTPNSIDVSPEAYALLDSGEYPRAMSFKLARCPGDAHVVYEMQDASSEWWTSFWVRNASEPVTKLEVQSVNHKDFVVLTRNGDGTFNDQGGFGKGGFTIRLTGMSGKQITHTFSWPADGIGMKLLEAPSNF